MIKAILFDFDGTLIDTNDLIFASYREAFKSVLKREISDDEILTMYGRPLYTSLMSYGEAGEALYMAYREFNESRHDTLAKSFAGVSEGVAALRQNGYKLGIVTSKRLELLMQGLRLLKLENAFDVLVTPENTKKAKPDPEPLLYACMKLKIQPCEAVYVGDSEFDLAAGRAAGTQICAVNYSMTPKSRLDRFSPEYYVDTIKELSDHLKRI